MQIESNPERGNTRLVCKHAKFRDAVQCPVRFETAICLSKMHAWFAMSLGAAGRVNQRLMHPDILIQDMGTDQPIDLQPNGNGKVSVRPASEKRVTADSIGCAKSRAAAWSAFVAF